MNCHNLHSLQFHKNHFKKYNNMHYVSPKQLTSHNYG